MIETDAPVVVYGTDDRVLAKTSLGSGVYTPSEVDGSRCDFPFTVEVPSGETVYMFDVAQRGHSAPETVFTDGEVANAVITVDEDKYAAPRK
ncbi:hypothetical protein GXW84_39470 [Rhodococcus sp. IEGM 248]|uniref:hypothetical protein n=1 Tax=Rhodococcus opacus TaxID=37919 RepID=UPI001062E450|nr:hypothetical protein [Rhodococcus opacus]MDV7090512.1 hypothetical protein [Rhodococcus opacus]NDV10422.1 hypothetical protein [Rhodococcus sp. IEGM 248]